MSYLEVRMYDDVDRAAQWFVRDAALTIPANERYELLQNFYRHLSGCKRMVGMVSGDACPKVKTECNADSREAIAQILTSYEGRKEGHSVY